MKLEGEVTQEAFFALADNKDPETGERLTVRDVKNRRPGYDLVFSPSKSVSAAWALTGDERIREAFRESVLETLREDIEPDIKTRLRRKGQNGDLVTGNVVGSLFLHDTTRPLEDGPDPHLHGHAYVFNVTWNSQEKRWQAVQYGALKADGEYYEKAFEARLARRINALGYGIERNANGWEIASVPQPVIDKFSRRTAEVEAEAKRRGITSPEDKADLGARTRRAKAENVATQELRRYWDSRLTESERRALAAVYANASSGGGRGLPSVTAAQAMRYAIGHVFAHDSTVPATKLLAHALQYGGGALLPEDVKRALPRQGLILGEEKGRLKATAEHVLGEEHELRQSAWDGRGTFPRLGYEGAVARVAWGKPPSPDQAVALEQMLASTDFITLFEASAGTGKTTTARALRQAVEETGRHFLAVAPSARASRGVLRDEGFADAETLKMLLDSKELQSQICGGVIFLDEGSLCGVPTFLQLVKVAKEQGARLVVAFDRMQHHSVERGDAARLLADEAHLPVARLRKNWRQSGDYDLAVEEFKQGNAPAGLKKMDRLGWVEEQEAAKLYERAAEVYCQWRAEVLKARRDPAKEILCVSPTHIEADRATAATRARLKAEGVLGEERTFDRLVPCHLTDAEKGDAARYIPAEVLQFHKWAPRIKAGQRIDVGTQRGPLPLEHPDRFSVYRKGTIRLAAGDLVQATANGKTQDGTRINNGDVLGVQGFTADGGIVTDKGVLGKEFKHLNYGYYATSHASQGRTVWRTLVVASGLSAGATNRTQAYVSVSRAKDRSLVLTDDKEALLETSARDDRRTSATEFARRHREAQRQHMQSHVIRMRRQEERELLRRGPPLEYQREMEVRL